jgi:hypothetical protein
MGRDNDVTAPRQPMVKLRVTLGTFRQVTVIRANLVEFVEEV